MAPVSVSESDRTYTKLNTCYVHAQERPVEPASAILLEAWPDRLALDVKVI
jgi:hypothetical protein